jgi:hypothetical protein
VFCWSEKGGDGGRGGKLLVFGGVLSSREVIMALSLSVREVGGVNGWVSGHP